MKNNKTKLNKQKKIFFLVSIIFLYLLSSNIIFADILIPGFKSIGSECVEINNIDEFSSEYTILYSQISEDFGILKDNNCLKINLARSGHTDFYAVKNGNYTKKALLNYFKIFIYNKIEKDYNNLDSNYISNSRKNIIVNLKGEMKNFKYLDSNLDLNIIELRVEDYSNYNNFSYKSINTTIVDPFSNIVHNTSLKEDDQGNLKLKENVTYRNLEKEGKYYLYFILGLLFTFLIEAIMLKSFFKKANISNFSWSKVFLFNLITYPLAVYFFVFGSFFLVELFVFIFEIFAIKLLFKISWIRSIKYSFIINFVTAILGYIFVPFLFQVFNAFSSFF